MALVEYQNGCKKWLKCWYNSAREQVYNSVQRTTGTVSQKNNIDSRVFIAGKSYLHEFSVSDDSQKEHPTSEEDTAASEEYVLSLEDLGLPLPTSH